MRITGATTRRTIGMVPPTEATALLQKNQLSPTPLPKTQLFIVYLIQLAEPITASVIYPFIAQFVRDTGITYGDETATGYFAGIIESVFFMAECVTVLLWGIASNRFGHRRILLIGPFGLALAMLGFGMSTTFWPLVFFRFMQGSFNGNIGVSKSVMAELSDSTNMAEGAHSAEPAAMLIDPTTEGPIIGGVFSDPAAQWPGSLGKITLFQNHPYLLLCLLAGSAAFVFFLVALCGLKEDKDDFSSAQSLQRCISEESMETPSIRSLMVRQVIIPLGCFAALTFTETSYSVLIPLMYSTSIEHGGLGFSSFQIGIIMGMWGAYNVIWQGAAVSWIIRRVGPRTVHIFGQSCLLIGFSMFIVTNAIARAYGEVTPVVWALVIVQFLLCNSMVFMSFGTGHMFIVDGAPSKASLTMTNGLGQVAGTISRTVAPVFANSLFSISTERNLLHGYLVFVILLLVTLAGIRCSLLLPKELRRAH
ncbi:Protein ZINC INDUCED FACILITATOR-LIKE 1 [Mycena sanguinolenta]|uniref:Protein ZINC INDUCED FACILITATOR-LIKE 1 n=1 Tax=Mycena sanguinolenta TaxID=230812 RepID=A0A8H6Y9A6_9AGAR|nr:Protein ZINC INDUCED FACILITATOR-LIKE 1 [Mycena sanguinolenta]